MLPLLPLVARPLPFILLPFTMVVGADDGIVLVGGAAVGLPEMSVEEGGCCLDAGRTADEEVSSGCARSSVMPYPTTPGADLDAVRLRITAGDE